MGHMPQESSVFDFTYSLVYYSVDFAVLKAGKFLEKRGREHGGNPAFMVTSGPYGRILTQGRIGIGRGHVLLVGTRSIASQPSYVHIFYGFSVPSEMLSTTGAWSPCVDATEKLTQGLGVPGSLHFTREGFPTDYNLFTLSQWMGRESLHPPAFCWGKLALVDGLKKDLDALIAFEVATTAL